MRKTFIYILALATFSLFQSTLPASSYQITNIISDVDDPELINPIGLAFDDRGNLIVADNGTNLVTSYKPLGDIRSFIFNALGDPSGLVRNYSKRAFALGTGKHPCHARYLIATESGTILAYNDNIDPNSAILVAQSPSPGAVYKGLAIAKINHRHFIYATDFFNSQIDVFDESFNYIYSFTDYDLPINYAPFNIRYLQGRLYVTFAKQLAPDNVDDDPGPGNGYVDVFDSNGFLINRLVSNGNLNSPWGLAIAPDNFGDFGGALLVGNHGDGTIIAYDPYNGDFFGHLKDSLNNNLTIDGLWSLKFSDKNYQEYRPQNDGQSTLYFTAGPEDETGGQLGKINVIDLSEPCCEPSHHHSHHCTDSFSSES